MSGNKSARRHTAWLRAASFRWFVLKFLSLSFGQAVCLGLARRMLWTYRRQDGHQNLMQVRRMLSNACLTNVYLLHDMHSGICSRALKRLSGDPEWKGSVPLCTSQRSMSILFTKQCLASVFPMSQYDCQTVLILKIGPNWTAGILEITRWFHPARQPARRPAHQLASVYRLVLIRSD